MEFYTYIWRDAKGVPFYVGKGKGRRAWATFQRSSEFKRIHSAGGCYVEIADWFIHESQAHAYEVELIAKYGRRDMGGVLVNKTDGGEGASGIRQTQSTREKISAALTGQKRSDEAKAKMSAAKAGNNMPHNIRLKISACHLGRKKTPETRHKMKIASLLRGASHYAVISDKVRMAPPNKANKSGLKGVSLHKPSGKWCASAGGKTVGHYANKEDAGMAYDQEAIRLWGIGNCYLNFPERISEPTPSSRTRAEATRMLPPRDGGYKGIRLEKRTGKWVSRIKSNGKETHIGTFPCEVVAARAYDRAAIAAWGYGNCYLNFPEGPQSNEQRSGPG